MHHFIFCQCVQVAPHGIPFEDTVSNAKLVNRRL